MLSLDDILKELLDEIFCAISVGNKKIVLWGINSKTLHILSILNSGGLLAFVSGLVDSRASIQGESFFGLQVQQPKKLLDIELDTLVITSDEEKEYVLEEFLNLDTRKPQVIFSGNTNYKFKDPIYESILKSCAVKSKAGGYPNMLIHLYQSLKYVATRKLQGDVAEFGMYQGGTTVFIAKVLEHYGFTGRIYGFDTFMGFPPKRSALDMYSDAACEFPDYETVKNYCEPFNIELISGDICETYIRLRGIPLVFSFIDTDNYSPAKHALEVCIEQTVPGGILAFDHFYSPDWSKTIGERIAIKQMMTEKDFFCLYGTGIFIKT